MEFGLASARCKGCGRTWRRYEVPKPANVDDEDGGIDKPFFVYMTEPKYPKVNKWNPRMKPKRD